jgi:hypothetical protein
MRLLRFTPVLAIAALILASAASASTATPLTWATSCASDLDVAGCERQTWIANKLDDPAPEAAPIAGTVALSDGDQTRLDLAWGGIWFLAGIALVLVLVPAWTAAWRFWRE